MNNFPIKISPDAVEQLKRILARKKICDGFIRIGVKGGGCSGLEYMLKIETNQKASDREQMFSGLKVICDPKSLQFLEGSTLVYTGNLLGGGFQFNNPNASRSCGCGVSFTPKSKGD